MNADPISNDSNLVPEETSGDPLLDLLLPLLPPKSQANVSKHKTAALESVANLRTSSLDTITSSTLETSLTYESDALTSKLSSLVLRSYPQLLQSASSVDTLLEQFSNFEKTSSEFYESQLTYLDQEIHHYYALSTSAEGEKLGEGGPKTAGQKANQVRTPKRRRSNSVLSSKVKQNNTKNNKEDEEIIDDDSKRNTEDAVILLKNLETIQDILELPSLIQACVNNGYYAEALDLAAHTSRLSKRYNQVHVIQDIQDQVDDAIKSMTVQLLQLLRESVKLPTLIKVVSYLRRVPPFSTRNSNSSTTALSAFSNSSNSHDLVTRQLQHLFLFSRLQYIRTLLDSLDPLKRQSPDMYLKRYVEVFREHVFVTVVGFRSVFPDTQLSALESDLAALSPPSSSETPSTNKTAAAPRSKISDNLIASFIRSLVSDFYNTINDIAPFIDDESTRSSLWLQISYCSKSLGRVGADFWPSWQGPEISSNTDKDDGAGGALSKKEWIAAIQKQMDISKHYSQTASSIPAN